jgi:hypothetical protein
MSVTYGQKKFDLLQPADATDSWFVSCKKNQSTQKLRETGSTSFARFLISISLSVMLCLHAKFMFAYYMLA